MHTYVCATKVCTWIFVCSQGTEYRGVGSIMGEHGVLGTRRVCAQAARGTVV